MNPNENEYIKPTDYYAKYNESIEALKSDPKALEFDKLCYELFHQYEQGKVFMKVCEKRFLIPALANIGTATYQIDCIWAEGFKEAFRTIMKCAESHDQRIKAEMNKK